VAAEIFHLTNKTNERESLQKGLDFMEPTAADAAFLVVLRECIDFMSEPYSRSFTVFTRHDDYRSAVKSMFRRAMDLAVVAVRKEFKDVRRLECDSTHDTVECLYVCLAINLDTWNLEVTEPHHRFSKIQDGVADQLYDTSVLQPYESVMTNIQNYKYRLTAMTESEVDSAWNQFYSETGGPPRSDLQCTRVFGMWFIMDWLDFRKKNRKIEQLLRAFVKLEVAKSIE